MYNVDDVVKILKCSKSKAYNIIKALNNKLIANGTPKEAIISGKISSEFFKKELGF